LGTGSQLKVESKKLKVEKTPPKSSPRGGLILAPSPWGGLGRGSSEIFIFEI
jgi:hypothetical protein